MVKITNKHKIDIPLAIWLLQDGYNSGANEAPPGELISVTTLMKPTRQLILKRKVNQDTETMDISDRIAARMGHGLHDSIERAWTEGNWKKAMKELHYPDKVIDKIKINPDPNKLNKQDIPIYLERRGFKKFQDIVITGQLDFLLDGAYRDFKTTSTFAYTTSAKDRDYILQGSLYRWTMPDLITDDKMRIEFIFTDWVKYRAQTDPNYPKTKVAHKEYTLMSLEETEQWIIDKLKDIRINAKLSQDDMVRCTDEELWKSKPSYKYYSDPKKAKSNGRCTKRFDSETDAQLHLKSKGKGAIVKEPGQVKACEYCPAFSVCEQRKEYFPDE